jgi:hypothetical protein
MLEVDPTNPREHFALMSFTTFFYYASYFIALFTLLQPNNTLFETLLLEIKERFTSGPC